MDEQTQNPSVDEQVQMSSIPTADLNKLIAQLNDKHEKIMKLEKRVAELEGVRPPTNVSIAHNLQSDSIAGS